MFNIGKVTIQGPLTLKLYNMHSDIKHEILVRCLPEVVNKVNDIQQASRVSNSCMQLQTGISLQDLKFDDTKRLGNGNKNSLVSKSSNWLSYHFPSCFASHWKLSCDVSCRQCLVSLQLWDSVAHRRHSLVAPWWKPATQYLQSRGN